MAGQVKIKVDLSAGSIDVEADADNIDSVFDRLDAFIPRLSEAYNRLVGESGNGSSTNGASSAATAPGQPAPNPTEQKIEPKKAQKGSKGKEVYTIVDLGLTETQRSELRDFYASKKPDSQKEQIAVLMDWLKREGHKEAVTWNDIFTAFRTVNVKSPGKISSVLGNMVGLSWVKNVGSGKYSLIHVGEDYVKYDLPKTAKNTTKA